MNAQQSITEQNQNNITTNKKNKRTIKELKEAEAKILAKLAEVQKNIKEKEEEKAKIQQTKDRKERARFLILGGIALAEMIRRITDPGNIEFIKECFEVTQNKNNTLSEKQRKKIEEDKELLERFIEKAKAGSL